MSMNVLVVGSKGMLGTELMLRAPEGAQVTGVDVEDVDITDRDATLACVKESKAQLILNAAAYTAVDRAEEDRELAHQVNAIGVMHLALAARSVCARVCHVSTDFVFDGEKGRPYAEFDAPNPLSVYGESKLWGEQLLFQVGGDHQVVRTQWLYGPRGQHFVRTILKAAKERPKLTVVNDQFGSPTCTVDLAGVLWDVALRGGPGIYHASGTGRTSWFEFTQAILEFAGVQTPVEPMSSDQLERKATRPADSTLENLRLETELGLVMRPWRDALEEYIKTGDVLES